MCCLPPWHLLTSAPLECVHGTAQATPEALSYSDEAFSCGKGNKAKLFTQRCWRLIRVGKACGSTPMALCSLQLASVIPVHQPTVRLIAITAQRITSDRSYYATVVILSSADDTVLMPAIHVICLHQHHKIDGLCGSGGNI